MKREIIWKQKGFNWILYENFLPELSHSDLKFIFLFNVCVNWPISGELNNHGILVLRTLFSIKQLLKQLANPFDLCLQFGLDSAFPITFKSCFSFVLRIHYCKRISVPVLLITDTAVQQLDKTLMVNIDCLFERYMLSIQQKHLWSWTFKEKCSTKTNYFFFF